MALPAPSAFSWSPLAIVVLGLVGAAQASLLVRARPAPGLRWRWGALAAGLLLLAVCLLSPLDTLGGHYLLSAHLVQNLVVMGMTPPLLLLALPPPTVERARTGARRAWTAPLRRALAGGGRVLVHPVTAIVSVNATFFVWHLPAIYDASLQSDTLYTTGQICLLAASMQFWWAIVAPAARSGMTPLLKLGYILLATIPQTFTGLLFAMARHPLYTGYASAPRVLGWSAITDQQLAGAGMALLSKVALFVAFTVVFFRLMRDQPDTDDRDDDGGLGSDGDAPRPVPGLPAWLGLLGSGRTAEEPTPPRRRQPVAPGSATALRRRRQKAASPR